MFEYEAFQVKQELLARGTRLALKLAGEIGIPSDGVIHGGEKFENRGMDAAAQEGRAERWQAKNGISRFVSPRVRLMR